MSADSSAPIQTNFPDFQEDKDFFELYIDNLKREFRLKRISSEQDKLDYLLLKLGSTTMQKLPSPAIGETFEGFTNRIKSKFRKPPSTQDYLIQLGLATAYLTHSSINHISDLILKSYPDADELRQTGELVSKMLPAAKTTFERFIISSTTKSTFAEAIETIKSLAQASSTNSNKTQVKSPIKCTHCQFIGHKAEECRRRHLPAADYAAKKEADQRQIKAENISKN
uniref:Uncharacterized protein n=1 Tax=Strongyloides stercoralis TaxID=6248 RepID=A0AAF5DIZ8_STRER